MEVKEVIQIKLTPDEAAEILKNHFSDKYDVDNVHFDVRTVYQHDMDSYGSYEVTEIRLVGKNKQSKIK